MFPPGARALWHQPRSIDKRQGHPTMTQENAVSPNPLPHLSGSNPQATYNDPALSGYWHLWGSSGGTRGANAVKVWDDYRGTGVIVGVIDDGVDYNHPELAGNYASTLDYDGRDGDADAYPSDPTDKHGTTVAGVIAAALNNSAGGAGVAPGASVAGFRIGFGSNGTDQQVLDAFRWMAAVDVANNSWGFDGFLEDSFLYPGFAPIRDALQTALDIGRNGLGTIVVFSAGNGRTSGQDVNYHGFQNHRGIIAAAATDSAGNVTWFSTPGAALLVAAPGQSVTTTDRPGASGYSSGDYATMSGTSFSAPIVSGVAALMLDANPGLGWRDVQEILAATAVQTGAATGWSFNGADNWNGGPMHVSYDYGFGLVDAFAAVRVAESWRGVSTSTNESVTSGAASGPVAIPDVGSVSRTITLTQSLRIDHVEVDVFLTHANIGQLQITLTAPDGTQSLLFHNPATSQQGLSFTFSTTRDWGEFSAGDWTLTIADTQPGASGTLTNWTLRAYGDVPGNDTYVYTDEFSVLAAADPARRVLSDGGGTDTLNTASISSDTLLDLRPGYSSSIDGQTLVISAGTVIENADSGDGNDVLIGNDAANSLRGWRGSDLLDGGLGADTLEGGVGDDIYAVDSLADVLVETASGGNDTVRTTLGAYVLGANLENLAYRGTGNFAGNGNSAANLIGGGAGNDTLDGGLGADTLSGGAGSDQYMVDSPEDSIVEEVNEGTDLVLSSITYALGANIENLSLTGLAAINGTGNELNNIVFSSAGNNVLDGGSGTDTASYAYAAGAVSVRLGTTGAQNTGASGTDTLLRIEGLHGSAFNDKLTGDAAANVIEGGSGSDTVVGGIDIVYSSLPSYTLTRGLCRFLWTVLSIPPLWRRPRGRVYCQRRGLASRGSIGATGPARAELSRLSHFPLPRRSANSPFF
jgi:subtilisin family serine protease